MKIVFPQFLANAVIRHAQKRPFRHLAGYMNRWWLLNPNGLVGKLVTARVHEILRSDLDRHLHDHPWPYLTVILKGGYTEVIQHDSLIEAHMHARRNRAIHGMPQVHYNQEMAKWESHAYYGAGSILFRPRGFAHRLIVEKGASATTMFIMGTKSKEQKWGFITPAGKVPHSEYLADKDDTKPKYGKAA